MRLPFLPSCTSAAALAFVFAFALMLPACGGGDSGSSPAPVSVSLDATMASARTGATQQFTATVTGSPVTTVSWSVNGVAGGNAIVGTISSNGLYTAPALVPTPAIVAVTATSSADAKQSVTATMTLTGTLETATQAVAATLGSTIALPSGSAVSIPAGALTQNVSLTATTATDIGETLSNGFVVGIGPTFTFSATGSVLAAGGGSIQVLLNLGTPVPVGMTGAVAIIDVVDSGGHNPMALSGATYNASTGTVTLTIPVSLLNGATSVSATMGNLAPAYRMTASSTRAALSASAMSLPLAAPPPPGRLSWNGGAWLPYAGCPATPSGKVLVLVHGMKSSVESAYGSSVTAKDGTTDLCVNQIQKYGNYTQVVGLDYDWSQDIQASGAKMASFLNTLAACGNSIDVEAHSEGGPVAASGILLSNGAAHSQVTAFVGLGNPWEGTPAAAVSAVLQPTVIPVLTALLNLNHTPLGVLGPDLSSVQVSGATLSSLGTAPFSAGLLPGSSPLTLIQQDLGLSMPNLKSMTLACGIQPNLQLRLLSILGFVSGTANDGIIPLGSCLALAPSGSAFTAIPNPARLPLYPLAHTDLPCDAQVIHDVGQQVNPPGPATPQLVVSPTTLSFTAQQGAANPAVQTLSAAASGATLVWTATSNATWLSLNKTSGDTSSANAGQVLASVSIGGLSVGTFHGTITYSYTGVSNKPVTVMVPVTLTVTSPPANVKLQVGAFGTGTGTVSASPTGTNCGTGCLSFPVGTAIQLTAGAASGSIFAGWSGACSVFSSNFCNLTMLTDTAVGVTFNALPTYTLTLLPTTGNGSGSVTAAPKGPTYNAGDSVSVTQTPATGSVFAGWTNACTGIAGCTIVMNSNQSVGAVFNKSPVAVVDNVSPRTVTSGSAGTCAGGTVSASFSVTSDSRVSWSVSPDSNNTVLGGGSLTLTGSGSGSGSFSVTITVPPQKPSSSFSNCSLTYNLGTFDNVFVSFSDGTVIGVTVFWTFVGVT